MERNLLIKKKIKLKLRVLFLLLNKLANRNLNNVNICVVKHHLSKIII